MFKDWNFWCTVMTSIAAVVALGLSVYQIQLSNKQQLFDRRLKAYNLVSSLISLCKENYTWLSEKRETKPQLANDFDFIYLTNNTYMEGQAEAIKHPLEQPFHKEFLKKREELRSMAMEFELIFKGDVALLYSSFLKDYESALAVMYQYQIIIEKIKEENGKHPRPLEELSGIFSEEKYRNNLYSALDKLKESYDVVTQEKVGKQLRKQIALI
ncbi:hypothetical protein [Roseburia hominis]|uniref:hypothetical protein n=1 Tax=Roseburia hominis TaxID=301301 RepID=UPI00242FD124|nr:hypothetical protein [Roseburia hominis]MBS5061983.1 hypothetical protein [Roseburia hominis]